jgi:hypothetical protein
VFNHVRQRYTQALGLAVVMREEVTNANRIKRSEEENGDPDRRESLARLRKDAQDGLEQAKRDIATLGRRLVDVTDDFEASVTRARTAFEKLSPRPRDANNPGEWTAENSTTWTPQDRLRAQLDAAHRGMPQVCESIRELAERTDSPELPHSRLAVPQWDNPSREDLGDIGLEFATPRSGRSSISSINFGPDDREEPRPRDPQPLNNPRMAATGGANEPLSPLPDIPLQPLPPVTGRRPQPRAAKLSPPAPPPSGPLPPIPSSAQPQRRTAPASGAQTNDRADQQQPEQPRRRADSSRPSSQENTLSQSRVPSNSNRARR